MKCRFVFLALFLSMGIFTLGRSSGLAYEVGHLRLTGTLLSIEAGERTGRQQAIEANIGGRQWIFEVAQAKSLKANGLDGRSILRQLFPARLTISGGDELLRELRAEENSGRGIAIAGYFYPASRVFFVTALKKLEGRS